MTILKYYNEKRMKKLVYSDIVKGEINIAFFRLAILLALFVLVIMVLASNNWQTSLSDLANLSSIGISFVYTIILFIVIRNDKYTPAWGYVSSTLDILLITATIYFNRYAPLSSVVSIMNSGIFAVYAPFILFTLQRHDGINTLYTGLLASAGYGVMIVTMGLENSFDVPLVSLEPGSNLVVVNNMINEIVKAVMLAAAGIIGFKISKGFDDLFISGLRVQEEKDHIKNMFGKYVSDTLVDTILTGQIPTDGEKRFISVMFIDVKNFTTLSEKVEPKVLIKIVNRYISYCISIISKHGGFIDKFLGDAIMVEFGVPVYNDKHREQAVACALELCKSSRNLKRFVTELGVEWDFDFGIGINSGEVILGNVGSNKRMEYTALGDTVNTASRFEKLTRELHCPIVIGEKTLVPEFENLVTKEHVYTPKGKTQPMKVHGLKCE